MEVIFSFILIVLFVGWMIMLGAGIVGLGLGYGSSIGLALIVLVLYGILS